MKLFIGKKLLKNMSLEESKLLALVYNDPLVNADAIVCLEGDGYVRVNESARLFQEKWAPIIVVSGGYNNPPFSIVAGKLADYLVKKGVPEEKIVVEKISKNTYEQATEVLQLADKNNWKTLILVASHFHQPRAYLTFIGAMKNLNVKISIINSPVRNLSWFQNSILGKNRLDLLGKELEKISEYQERGHLSSFKEAIDYQKWKEENR